MTTKEEGWPKPEALHVPWFQTSSARSIIVLKVGNSFQTCVYDKHLYHGDYYLRRNLLHLQQDWPTTGAEEDAPAIQNCGRIELLYV
jgi:hypothetical protein